MHLHRSSALGYASAASAAQREPWPEASGCCRDVGQHGSAAAKPCWASLLETDEQNTEHAENANTNMGKCDD